MFSRSKELLFIFYLIYPFTFYGHDFVSEIEKLKGKSQAELLETYPFEEYLTSCTFPEIQTLKFQKRLLDQLGFSGDDFLMRLVETYLNNIEIDFEDLPTVEANIKKGEILMNSSLYFPREEAFIFVVCGDMILSTFADTLESLIYSKDIDKQNTNIQYIVKQLDENQFMIDIPVSNWAKLWMHLKAFNLRYIWKKATGTYVKEFMIFLLTFFLAIGLLFCFRIRFLKKKKNTSSSIVLHKAEITLLVPFLFLCFTPSNSNTQLINERKLIQTSCESAFDNLVITHTLSKIENNQSRPIGHSIWLELTSSRIQAHYIPSESNRPKAFKKLNEWSRKNDIVVLSGAAYAMRTYEGQMGFSMDKGRIINKKWEDKMDAVVIFQDGAISALEKNGPSKLKGIERFDLSYTKEKFISPTIAKTMK